MQVLWTEEYPVFNGEFVSFDEICFEPKPVQKPYPPIWIGGNSEAAMLRAVRYGDIWNPSMVPQSRLPTCLNYMKSLPEWNERDRPLQFHLPVEQPNIDRDHTMTAPPGARRWSTQELIDAVGELQELGVTWTTLPTRPDSCLNEHMDQLQYLSEDVMTKFPDQRQKQKQT